MKIDCIIARYNEDINWILEYPFNTFNIICYNKGLPISENVMYNNCKIVSLENIGLEVHTYLYHIITQYDNLADITLFVPGNCMSVVHKKNYTTSLIEKMLKTQNTVLQGHIINNLQDLLYNFQLEEYKLNPLIQSPIRPYGTWFNTYFKNSNAIKILGYWGIFAIAKDHIIQHPKEYYQNLIETVNKSSNPEAAHYMERSWGAVFYPYPESCIHSYIF